MKRCKINSFLNDWQACHNIIDNIKIFYAEGFRGLGAERPPGEKGEPFSTIGKRIASQFPFPRSLSYGHSCGREDKSNLRKYRLHSSGGRGTGDVVSRNCQRTAQTTPAANPAMLPGRESGAGLIRSVNGPGPMRNAETTQAQANR